MKIYSINSNPQTSFTAGIHHRVFDRAVKDGGNCEAILKKAKEINAINNADYTITGFVHNAKEKTTEFFLTVSDMLKSEPGMETIKPQSIISKGENVSEALLNIDSEKLKEANELLASSYSKQYKETEQMRNQILKERIKNITDLQNKYDNFRSYWTDLYRQNMQ